MPSAEQADLNIYCHASHNGVLTNLAGNCGHALQTVKRMLISLVVFDIHGEPERQIMDIEFTDALFLMLDCVLCIYELVIFLTYKHFSHVILQIYSLATDILWKHDFVVETSTILCFLRHLN